jgi:ankyrin repeat protein
MDLLQRKARRSKWAVIEAITELPRTLDETYEDAMERIRSQHPDDVELALRALKWVYFAREPLDLKDFQYAMVINQGDTNIQQNRVDEPEYVASVCAGMIQLDSEAQVIRPVHETAQDYFERQANESAAAHLLIAATCLTYFLSDRFYQIPTHVRRVDLINSRGPVLYRARIWAFLSQNCFARYAATYTMVHICRSSQDELLDMLIKLSLEGAKLKTDISSPFIAGPKLTAFLLAQPEDAFSTGRFGNMGPFQFAAGFRLNHLIPIFIRRGVDVNGRDYNQHTPLYVSTCVGNEEATKMLLDAGANVNATSRVSTPRVFDSELRVTPLNEAYYRGWDSIVLMLIAKGARIHNFEREFPSIEQQPPVGDVDSTELCYSIAKREIENKLQHELSLHSDKSSQISRVLYMLSKHVDLTEVGFGNFMDVEDDCGRRPLDWALAEGNAGVLTRLLNQGANVNEFRMLGKLHDGRYSLNFDVVECFKLVLDARPSLKLDGADASTLFSQAVHHKNFALIRLLLRRESQFEGAAFVSYRALLSIVQSGETDLIEPILRRAANPAVNDRGPPMIWVASFLGHTEMVQALHSFGANINTSCHGLGTVLGTPLAAAASSAKLETVKALISLGAQLNTISSRLGTALDIATALDRTEVGEYLTQQGGTCCRSGSILTKHVYDLTFSKVAAGTG